MRAVRIHELQASAVARPRNTRKSLMVTDSGVTYQVPKVMLRGGT
jgi:hypothetical protein